MDLSSLPPTAFIDPRGANRDEVDALMARPWLTLATAPDTNLVCFRAAPDRLAPEGQDDLNARLQRRLHDEDGIFLSLPIFRERRWLRAVLLNPHMDAAGLDRLLADLDRLGAEERAA